MTIKNSLIAALLLFVTVTLHAALVDLGPTFTPTGANYSITALQNGVSGAAHVNRGFEFSDGIGVSYVNSSNHLTPFGIGLYGTNLSTGLRIDYNSAVIGATVTLEDFDISGNLPFNFARKVAPFITFLGAGGSVIGQATPQQIRGAMTSVGNDVWQVDLNQLHSGAINGFILSADFANGERVPSDPYFMTVAGGCPVVPEVANMIPIGLLVGTSIALEIRRRRRANS
jgi:hypothetical protein